MHHTRILQLLSAAAVLLLTSAACSPALSPLYRDYKVEQVEGTLEGRIEAALSEAGWTVLPAEAAPLTKTEPRTMNSWGLYKVTVSLEVVPVGGDYVRVFIHPYREYVTGGKSKIPYLPTRIRQALLPDLNEAFEAKGLAMVGTPFERDRGSRQ